MQEGRWKQILGEAETDALGGQKRVERERNGVRWGGRQSILFGGKVGLYGRGEKFFTRCKCLILGQVKVTRDGCK